MKFTQEKTNIAKGVAICLMFTHHLFSFKNRLINGNNYFQIIPFFDAEVALGDFGSICVAMFLFLSGYGMFLGYLRAKTSPITYALRKIKDFYLTYWLYFLIFVPIGILFFKNVTLWNSQEIRYIAEPHILLKGFLGFSSRYNAEWWFVRLFIAILIISPIYLRLIEKNPILILSISFLVFCLHLQIDGYIDHYLSLNLSFWQILFALGMLCAKTNFFAGRLIEKIDKYNSFITVLIILLCFIIHPFVKDNYEFLIIPFFIYASVRAITILNLSQVFSYLGKYSFPLWLVHSFFCYYYFQNIVYCLKWSPLVFVVLTSLSLLPVLGIEYLCYFLSQLKCKSSEG
ncbi:MAG: acyltransferase family protein [Nostoc sp.]|uniref:acyltransferase family protein n=1 Tax=Nostoc sp. TaxID=1180 RepID=UPI002FF69BA3